jgi:hypothetical protein
MELFDRNRLRMPGSEIGRSLGIFTNAAGQMTHSEKTCSAETSVELFP